MENTGTVKNLTLIPQLFLGGIRGAFAGGVSGGLAGGVIFTAFTIFMFLIGGEQDPSLTDFVTAYLIGAIIGTLSAAPIGGLFGLFDRLWDGRLSSSLGSELAWAMVGAVLGPVGGAILLGLLSANSPPTGDLLGLYLLSWVPVGIIFGLPAGAITGLIFGFVYKRLATISPALKPTTAS